MKTTFQVEIEDKLIRLTYGKLLGTVVIDKEHVAVSLNGTRAIRGHSQDRIEKKVIAIVRDLLDFAPENTLPRIYKVTFETKSCGYFLKDRTYYVFATPVGIPDIQSGEVKKGWLFCDIFCGVPAIIPQTRESFIAQSCNEGDTISIFTLKGDELIYNPTD